jgi:hypothetical protein
VETANLITVMKNYKITNTESYESIKLGIDAHAKCPFSDPIFRWVRDNDWLLDGRGRFFDTRGAKNRDDYRDVSTSDDPEVVAARQRFETYLQDFPLPDENDPSTRKAWQRFRASPKGAPVEVFRPVYLQ